MNQELVEVTDSIDTFDTNYKVQYIRLLDLPVNLNDNPAEPFFIKANLDYDKYELPNVIPFEEFDMLFRPLKSSNIFKLYLFWKKMVNPGRFMWVIWIISFFLTLFISRKPIVTFVVFGILYFLILGFVWHTGHVFRTFLTEIQSYCPTIQSESVTVKLFNTYYCRMKLFTHFEISSKIIEEDDKKMKIYSKLGGEEIILENAEHLFRKHHFMFEQHLLNKFLTFEQFQQKIRAFKQNHAYKAYMFWRKVMILSFFLIILLYFKLLLDFKVISFLLLLASVILRLVAWNKRSNSKSKMMQQLRIFCEGVSFEDQRVQVIAHLRENPRKKRCCLPVEDELYCFEIRKQDFIQS